MRARKQESARLGKAQTEITKAQAAHQALIQNNLAAVQTHERHLQALTSALNATDAVLREHEIPIDPNDLPSVSGHITERIAGYSQITSLIYEALGQATDGSLSTTEVALYISTRMDFSIEDEDFPDFKYRIRKRLGGLVWQGRLERLHLPKTSVEGRWRLPKNRGVINQE